jgi:hypothetical protein
MAVKTIKVLRAARKLVADERTWTTGWFARDAIGRQTQADDPKANKWCVLGAIRKHCTEQDLLLLWKPLDILADRRGWDGVIQANDRHGRKAALRVLDDAIAELEAQ